MAIFRRVFLAPPGGGDGQIIPASGQPRSGAVGRVASNLGSSAHAAAADACGGEALEMERAAAAEAEALATAEASEAEARRTLERLTSGGSRMPCYGK